MRDPILQEGPRALRAARLDIFAFASAFVAGLASYFALRVALPPHQGRQLWQIIAIIACLTTYAIVVAKVPRLRVRLDQAGDNAYYLGLLFTLASMAFALYDFGRSMLKDAAGESGIPIILSNFGVALASTIAGIFIRVVLHQMRVDPADVESMTRIELAEAAKRVKGTLDSVTIDMSRFHDDVQQRTQDVVSKLLETLKRVLEEYTMAVATSMTTLLERSGLAQNTIVEKTTEVIGQMQQTADGAAEAIEKLRRVEPPPLKLASRLDKVTGSLEALGGQLDALPQKIERSGVSAKDALDNLVLLIDKLRSLTDEDRNQHIEDLGAVQAAVTDVKTELGRVGRVLATDVSLVTNLEEQARRSADLVKAAQEATSGVLIALTESTRALTDAVKQAVAARLD